MDYRVGWRGGGLAAGLVACGVAADGAWRHGLWGTLTGALLAAIWLAALTGWITAHRQFAQPSDRATPADPSMDGLLLDAAPTPMLMIHGDDVRTLNRAARRLFGSDDRVVRAPAALSDNTAGYLRHEGRQWRIDRVTLGGMPNGRFVVALIDVEQEERVAEARATAEMIHVLGHELLNGLAPIVSLAESGEAALDIPDADPTLIREIIGTLARRAEGLQQFTEAYRDLARLPPPRLALVPAAQLIDDLARLFAGRWPDVHLTTRVEDGPDWPLDRDQFHQALWAVLQNGAEAATTDRVADAHVMLAVGYAGEEMVVDVQDNGNGIPTEQVGRIFRPFHTTKPDGTGIGLSLARQIALAHGGSLTLMLEERTTFRLSLPSKFSDHGT